MVIRLIDRISASGIRSISGERYKDVSHNNLYTISKDKRRIGAGRFPRTSSLLVLYKNSKKSKRIYVKNHMDDILIDK